MLGTADLQAVDHLGALPQTREQKVSQIHDQQRQSVLGMPKFEAAAATAPASMGERRAITGDGSPPAEQSLLAATRWDPEQAEITVARNSSTHVSVVQYYYWNGWESSTKAMPTGWGLEFQVDMITQHPDYQSHDRPGCAFVNYKDRPSVKNYSWNWSMLVNVGSGMGGIDLNSIGAYADYNDSGDPCRTNSIAIGLRYPRNIPAYPTYGIQEILINIVAPRGLDNSSLVTGQVQTVSDHWCGLFPWMPLTDCMGVSAQWPGPGSANRLTLSENRARTEGWYARDKCWTSFAYGQDPVNWPPTASCSS